MATNKETTNIQPEILLNENEIGGGTISISENVFASIIQKYALEVPHVIGFGTHTVVDSIVEMISKATDKNIQVDIEDDCVRVGVNVVVEFGQNIPSVAADIQNILSTKIEEITGKSVAQVNVIVSDLAELQEAETTTEVIAEAPIIEA